MIAIYLIRRNAASQRKINMSNQAFISWEKYEEENCYLIAHLFVPVEERGQGKGRNMLQEAIEEMSKEGAYNEINLSADSDSEDPENPIDLADLVQFYESEGFEVEFAGDVVVMSMSI